MLEYFSNEYSSSIKSDSQFYNDYLSLIQQNEKLSAENTELKNIILRFSHENHNNDTQL